MRHSAKSKNLEISRQESYDFHQAAGLLESLTGRRTDTPSDVELGQEGFGQNTVPTDPTVPIVPIVSAYDAHTEEAPPPVYNELYGSLDISQDGLNTHASLASKRESSIGVWVMELTGKMMGAWKFA